MVTNVTYNAITTDFWGNLDAISGKESWEMHGTGGDAKGQPTQTNSISHGSPYLRIRKILVGAAYAELGYDGYEPPSNACATLRSLYRGLEEFEQLMQLYVHLETNVLLSRAAVWMCRAGMEKQK